MAPKLNFKLGFVAIRYTRASWYLAASAEEVLPLDGVDSLDAAGALRFEAPLLMGGVPCSDIVAARW